MLRGSVSLSLPLAAALSAAFVLAPNPAQAEDRVTGTRGGAQMSEREHTIALTFERGHATLVVRRTLHNALDRHDEAQLWLDIPEGAVATGVRTLGHVDGEPRWYEGELLEAELAAARYQELTGLGGYYPKDPVLLSWRDPTLLAMQVFPIEPGADKVVEYTLTMPATWDAGRWQIDLPTIGSATMPAEITLDPGQTLDQLFVDGEVVGRHHWLEASAGARIELAPRDPDPVTIALASVDTGERRSLVEFDIALAAEISELPRKARIVVALDLSRSRSPSEVEAQRAAAIAYLEHFRDPALEAEVALIGFDREIHELTREFVGASEAITTLSQATLTSRNGSEIDKALARASALLERAPARVPRRIVLMTDFETASRLTPEALGPIVDRSKAIVHLASVRPGEAVLRRDDNHTWASLAARSEGVLWSASAPELGDPDAALEARAVFEEWARPVRIDAFEVELEGLRLAESNDFYVPRSLEEGQGIDVLELSAGAVTKLSAHGLTWNRRFEQVARPSETQGDLWSALIFGNDRREQLSEPEMMVLAMRGRAVSPVTSYLAIEPGVRPSTEGIESWERSLTGRGSGGGSGSMFASRAAGAKPSFDHHAWLTGELDEARRRCGGADRSMAIELETTHIEIVDVVVNALASNPDIDTCVRQSIWSLELPWSFDQRFVTWTIVL